MTMIINNVHEAWNYYHANKPGYTVVDRFASQSRHGGPPGVTHLISVSPDEKEYLTRKSYWADNPKICGINNLMTLPVQDRHSPGETIKTRMFAMMQGDVKDEIKISITHVTVMKDGRVYEFDAKKIVDYVMKYQSYCDHEYAGENGAVYYPLRLASGYLPDVPDGQSRL